MSKEKDKFIAETMVKLEITQEEALELWDFDHEEIDNEAVDEIEKKIEKAKPKAPSTIGKVLTMKAKKKVDEEKEKIVEDINNFIVNNENMNFPQFMSANKISFKSNTNTYYTVAITKHKNKPDGYKGEKNVEEN